MTAEGATTGLKPKLSLFGGISMIVGCIIGSGIFISPKGVLEGTGSVGLSLIVWILCGLFSMVGAYCYAELGTMITESGADYTYMLMAFGPFCAFLRLWVECIIVRPCCIAIVALIFAYYVIEPIFPGCDQPAFAVRLLAAACIFILSFVNCWSVRWASRVQNVFTVGKVLALITIIITGIVKLCQGHTENFQHPFENTTYDVGAISLSFYAGLFSYGGWNYLNYVIEELKNPKKNLPLAIFISIIVCIFVNGMTNVAYFSVLSPQEVMASNAVAVTFAEKAFGQFSWCIPIFVSLSTFGTVNGTLFSSSRLFYVGARHKQMPAILCWTHVDRETPVPAVIFTGLSCTLYLVSTDIFSLLNYMFFVNWLAIGLSVLILLIFRKTMPNAERPIKVWLGWPILFVGFSLFLVAMPMYASPVETGIGCLIIATGIPVYVILIKIRKPLKVESAIDRATVTLQKILWVINQENLGRKNAD